MKGDAAEATPVYLSILQIGNRCVQNRMRISINSYRHFSITKHLSTQLDVCRDVSNPALAWIWLRGSPTHATCRVFVQESAGKGKDCSLVYIA